MASLELAVEIAAPPNDVAVFFVPQRMPYWYGTGMDTHFEVLDSAPEFHVGMKVRIVARVSGRELAHTAVVTAFDWGRLLEWQFLDSYGVRGRQRWEIDPPAIDCMKPRNAPGGHALQSAWAAQDETPRTAVRMTDRYELPGRAGRIMDRFFTRHAVRRRDRDDLAALKRFVERRESRS